MFSGYSKAGTREDGLTPYERKVKRVREAVMKARSCLRKVVARALEVVSQPLQPSVLSCRRTNLSCFADGVKQGNLLQDTALFQTPNRVLSKREGPRVRWTVGIPVFLHPVDTALLRRAQGRSLAMYTP